MIRDAHPEDVPSLVALVVAAGMFSPQESGLVAALLDTLFADAPDGHACFVDDEADGPVGVAYMQPVAAADAVWDLTMLAVRPGAQRGGRGAALMAHAEERLRAEGRRLLLVQTSGTPEYDRARSFYAKVGYAEAARVRDYWTDGDDLVLFRKDLRTG